MDGYTVDPVTGERYLQVTITDGQRSNDGWLWILLGVLLGVGVWLIKPRR